MLYDNEEVFCSCGRGVQGGGGSASKISHGPLLVCRVDRLTDEHRQELLPWIRMFADDVLMCGEVQAGGSGKVRIPCA